jgi:hypothetical protein
VSQDPPDNHPGPDLARAAAFEHRLNVAEAVWALLAASLAAPDPAPAPAAPITVTPPTPHPPPTENEDEPENDLDPSGDLERAAALERRLDDAEAEAALRVAHTQGEAGGVENESTYITNRFRESEAVEL